jgi:hypothetical protein
MPHLDKHWIAGVFVGLKLLAVSVKQDGLGPQDQHNVVGIRSCAHNNFITTSGSAGSAQCCWDPVLCTQ